MPKIYSYLLLAWVLALISGCSKSGSGSPSSSDSTVVAADPELPATVGFFLDDWTQRQFNAPLYKDTTLPSLTPSDYLVVNPGKVIAKVPRSIFGQNANSYLGLSALQPALLNNLDSLRPHIIRFPGGSLSDNYFWNEPKGSLPSDVPSLLLDATGKAYSASYWLGMNNTDSWIFSLDDYYTMLTSTGSEGIITVNYGYARYGLSSNPVANAAHLAAEWVRHDNGRTKYWEVGNENYGNWESGYWIDTLTNQDHQPSVLTGKIYGTHFLEFADSMRAAARQIGKTIYIGLPLEETASPASSEIASWNSEVLKIVGNAPDFYTVHSYFTNYNENSSVSQILATPSAVTSAVMTAVKNSVTSSGVTQKPIAFEEYNIFSTGSAQQSSYINGIHAIMVLGEAIANNFGMAARWDIGNAWSSGDDMGLFSMGDTNDNDPLWNPRASFYFLYYFNRMLGDRMIQSTKLNSSSVVKCYAGSFSSGQLSVTLINTGTSVRNVDISISNFTPGARCYWYLLTGGTDKTFSRKVYVNGIGPSYVSGGPSTYGTLKALSTTAKQHFQIAIPPLSVIFMTIDSKK